MGSRAQDRCPSRGHRCFSAWYGFPGPSTHRDGNQAQYPRTCSPQPGGDDRQMMSTESWPQPAIRLWLVAQRFQKFLLVGAVGLAVNQAMLYLLHEQMAMRLRFASPIAIFISMIVTFLLNEHWTWHDRGGRKIIHRVGFYFPINSGGLIINFGVLALLTQK